MLFICRITEKVPRYQQQIDIIVDLYNRRYTRDVRIFFSEQECDLVTVLVCINLTLPQLKSCSVQMPGFLNSCLSLC